MSTESRISQRDRVRQARLDGRRSEHERRRQLESARKTQRREEAIRAQIESPQSDVDRLLEDERGVLGDGGAWVEAQIQRAEVQQDALFAGGENTAMLHRIAMHWQDPSLVTRVAAQAGYVALGPGVLRDGIESQPVEHLYRGAQGEQIGLAHDGEGFQVVSEDTPGAERFASSVAKLICLERIFEKYGQGGAAITPSVLPNGEIALEVQLQDGSLEPAGLRLKTEPGGDLSVDVRCVKGRACHDLVQEVADGVDGRVVESRNKSDYYDTARQRVGGQQDVQR